MEKRLTNHVAILLDASYSMHTLRESVVKVAKRVVDSLKTSSETFQQEITY